MITKFKVYENKFYPGGTNGPLIGDYIILKSDKDIIGQIVSIDEFAPFNYYKIYLEIPEEHQGSFWFKEGDILYYSKNREDMVTKIEADKFNI